MNLYFNIFVAFILNNIYLESKIVKFKFDIYPINLVDIDSIKSYNYYPKPEVNIYAKADFMYRLLTDDFYFNLTSGTLPQIIPTVWNMNKYSFKDIINHLSQINLLLSKIFLLHLDIIMMNQIGLLCAKINFIFMMKIIILFQIY